MLTIAGGIVLAVFILALIPIAFATIGWAYEELMETFNALLNGVGGIFVFLIDGVEAMHQILARFGRWILRRLDMG